MIEFISNFVEKTYGTKEENKVTESYGEGIYISYVTEKIGNFHKTGQYELFYEYNNVHQATSKVSSCYTKEEIVYMLMSELIEQLAERTAELIDVLNDPYA